MACPAGHLVRGLRLLGSPPAAYRLAGAAAPWLLGGATLLMLVGAFGGLVSAPPDDQQGDGFRIIYFHVPASFLSMLVYVVMALTSGIGLVWRMKVAFAVAASCAPVGASFAGLALATGALWGQPMWGTPWEWEPRISSTFILLLLYLGYMVLRAAFDDLRRADRAGAVLALAGVVNVPVIHYSVVWWNSIHQGPSLAKMAAPSMPWVMLWPLLTMIAGFSLLFLAVMAIRLQAELMERDARSRWVMDLIFPGD